MPKQKLLLFIASALLLVGIIGSALTFQTANAETEDMKKTEEIDNNAITKIHVTSDNAGIEVVPTNEEKIKVDFTAPASQKNNYKLLVKEKGDTLSVKVQEKVIRFLLFSLDFSFESPKLTVYLPEKQYEEFKTDVVNGRIHVEDIVVQQINVETTNGRIELIDLSTDSASVSSENGSILLENVDGDVTSEVVNGRTTYRTEKLDHAIDLESVNGKIIVETDEDPTNATIEAETVNGHVEILGQNNRSVTFGNGEHKIRLETVNGSVTVTK